MTGHERHRASLGIAPKLTEKAFMGQIVQLAKILGWSCFHCHDSRHSAKGFPDLCLVRPPKLIFAELKTDTGRVSAEQQQWLKHLQACGQDARLLRPKDWPEIEAMLKGES